MHIPTYLALGLILAAAPSDAGLSPGVYIPIPGSVSKAVDKVHRVAQRHSAGLARDLRLALRPVLLSADVQKQQQLNAGGIWCGVSSSGTGFGGNGTSPSSSSPSASGSSSRPSITKSSGSTSTASASGPAPTSNFNLIESHQGSNFFDGWTFNTGSDPTHGAVTYVDQNTAQNAGLASINDDGHAIMRIETTQTVASTRQSVRITTNSQTSGGALVLMDAVHMPTGCATWPAWWGNGPNWPQGGEVDIIEGVNDYTNNQATIHTNPGCSLSSGSSSTLGITGTVVGGTNCAAAETGNQGCGVRAAQSNSFGAAFNSAGGGVYAFNWDEDGLTIWFFARSSIPSDIANGAPDPTSWGTPMANWPASGCSPFQFFYQVSFIFDTTLCGDWAGSAWTGTGIPGQDQSCAQRTGFSTCEAFVQASGSSFQQAYWEINYVKIYQAK